MEKTIIIVGGGFGGIRTALDLEKRKLKNVRIILISDKTHFEFHASLYRVLTGHSPLEVCIPLSDIFQGKKVEILHDHIIGFDTEKKELKGESDSIYHYDYLVLALGSEPNYYGIPGLEEYSYNIGSITSTLRLKRHLHENFAQCQATSQEDQKCSAHIVVVGGGAAGCEVAGELAIYSKVLAKQHNIDPSLVKIDLIQSGDRILPYLQETVSQTISDRLKKLGVNILLNKRLMKEEVETVYFPDVKMKTKTLIWTAGVKPNDLYLSKKEFEYDEKGRVKVDEHLKASDAVYVIGDGASTKYSGLATTAVDQGRHVAAEILEASTSYVSQGSPFIIPIGPGWAAAQVGTMNVFSVFGWIVKRLWELRYFMSILPFRKALTAFEADGRLTESCPICSGTQ